MTAPRSVDECIRPKRLADCIGHERPRRFLKMLVDAAMETGESVHHILFVGPAGLGKTTLAEAVAHEMETDFFYLNATTISDTMPLVNALSSAEDGDVIFIDEIHRMPGICEEWLYEPMERLCVNVPEGDPIWKAGHWSVAPFTLIGATTRPDLLSKPLLSRFGEPVILALMTPDDLGRVVKRSAAVLGWRITEEAAAMISAASKGVPRAANVLLKRAHCRAVVESGLIDTEAVAYLLDATDVEAHGLNASERAVLNVLADAPFNKRRERRPIGLATLASVAGVADAEVVKETVEPYLLWAGLITRGGGGRVITPKGLALIRPPKTLEEPETPPDPQPESVEVVKPKPPPMPEKPAAVKPLLASPPSADALRAVLAQM